MLIIEDLASTRHSPAWCCAMRALTLRPVITLFIDIYFFSVVTYGPWTEIDDVNFEEEFAVRGWVSIELSAAQCCYVLTG